MLTFSLLYSLFLYTNTTTMHFEYTIPFKKELAIEWIPQNHVICTSAGENAFQSAKKTPPFFAKVVYPLSLHLKFQLVHYMMQSSYLNCVDKNTLFWSLLYLLNVMESKERNWNSQTQNNELNKYESIPSSQGYFICICSAWQLNLFRMQPIEFLKTP